MPAAPHWRRNLVAVTGASFIGFAGFTLVMPLLPLYFQQLGVTDVGEIAVWSGLTLGVTPAMTAVLSPLWGRLADRFGRKLMVGRSIFSFVVIMVAMAYITHPWQAFALRVVQGFFAGYGMLALAMAADSAPPERMASAIGTVQTAQRLGPAVGPVVGGVVAQLVGMRDAFLVAAGFYAVGFVLVLVLYREPPGAPRGAAAGPPAMSWRALVSLPNVTLLVAVVFVMQWVERSLGPILPIHLATTGIGGANVALAAGVLFSLAAAGGAMGNVACGRLLARHSPRQVIVASALSAGLAVFCFLAAPPLMALVAAAVLLGLGAGAAATAAFTAAGVAIPAAARASGFGVVSSGALAGLAISPMVNGAIARWSLPAVFVIDVLLLAGLAWLVFRRMEDRIARDPAGSPAAQVD